MLNGIVIKVFKLQIYKDKFINEVQNVDYINSGFGNFNSNCIKYQSKNKKQGN